MAERRRGHKLEAALLEAAWDELIDVGYAALTLDGVATRAKTSRPVLARRWPDKLTLVRAAVSHVADRYQITSAPDTGTLRGDVLELMRELNRTRIGLLIAMQVRLVAYHEEDGATPQALRDFVTAEKPHLIEHIFERAAARGETDPDGLDDRIKRLPFDLLRQELLTRPGPAPETVLESIVDRVFLPLARG